MLNIEKFDKALERQVLEETLSPKTRQYYSACLKAINAKLKMLCFDNDNENLRNQWESQNPITPSNIETIILSICKENKQIAKYVAAVKKYEKEILKQDKALLFGEPLIRLTTLCKDSTGEGKPLSLPESTYAKKYNRLKNKKLKLAFRLQANSGLRVSEVADLQSNDILFNQDGTMTVNVRNGKGRKARIVNVIDDQYLYKNLKEHIKNLNKNAKLFYSSEYLRKKASEYGIPTHDLRRVNAKKRYREGLADGLSKREARKTVSSELGHEDVTTTNLYLVSDTDEERGTDDGV